MIIWTATLFMPLPRMPEYEMIIRDDSEDRRFIVLLNSAFIASPHPAVAVQNRYRKGKPKNRLPPQSLFPAAQKWQQGDRLTTWLIDISLKHHFTSCPVALSDNSVTHLHTHTHTNAGYWSFFFFCTCDIYIYMRQLHYCMHKPTHLSHMHLYMPTR